MTLTVILLIAITAVGAAVLVAGAYEHIFGGNAAEQFLASLDDADAAEDEFVARLRQPFVTRSLASMRAASAPVLRRVTPQGVLARTREDLRYAGLTTRI